MFHKENRIMLKCMLAIAVAAALVLFVHPAFAGEEDDLETYKVDEQIKEADEQFTDAQAP